MSGTTPANPNGEQLDEHLQRAYALNGIDSARDLYNDWAKVYDSELPEHIYASPQAAVDVLAQYWPESTAPRSEATTLVALDAGCGTGLVGDRLRQSLDPHVQLQLDGVDLTPGMLDVARQKAIYRHLWPADLNERLDAEDSVYDVVFCVGTLTKGHVGPGCLAEFARVTRAGGLVVATVHDGVWVSMGFKDKVDELCREGRVRLVSADQFGIIKGETEGARMVVLRRA